MARHQLVRVSYVWSQRGQPMQRDVVLPLYSLSYACTGKMSDRRWAAVCLRSSAENRLSRQSNMRGKRNADVYCILLLKGGNPCMGRAIADQRGSRVHIPDLRDQGRQMAAAWTTNAAELGESVASAEKRAERAQAAGQRSRVLGAAAANNERGRVRRQSPAPDLRCLTVAAISMRYASLSIPMPSILKGARPSRSGLWLGLLTYTTSLLLFHDTALEYPIGICTHTTRPAFVWCYTYLCLVFFTQRDERCQAYSNNSCLRHLLLHNPHIYQLPRRAECSIRPRLQPHAGGGGTYLDAPMRRPASS